MLSSCLFPLLKNMHYCPFFYCFSFLLLTSRSFVLFCLFFNIFWIVIVFWKLFHECIPLVYEPSFCFFVRSFGEISHFNEAKFTLFFFFCFTICGFCALRYPFLPQVKKSYFVFLQFLNFPGPYQFLVGLEFSHSMLATISSTILNYSGIA